MPVGKLKWIKVPERNGKDDSTARIYYESAWGPQVFRTGKVRKIRPAIEPGGRMAGVIVEMADPLGIAPDNREKPVLLLDSCVRVEIEGKTLENSVKLPRIALRDGDSAWVLTDDGTLDIRAVTIGAQAPEHVFVTDGLEEGMRLITSDIPTPVEGMKLRAHSGETGQPAGDRKPGGDAEARSRE